MSISIHLQCRRPPAMQRHRFDPWVEKIPWRRKWQPTPAFLPGKSRGERSLVGYSPWGRKVGHNLMTKPPSPHVNFKFLNYPFPWVLSEFRVQTELVAHWWGSWRGKRASPPPEEAEGNEGEDLLQVTSPRNGRSTPQAGLGSLVSADEKTKPLPCGLFSHPELVPDYCGN